ncbi:MAG: M15 family metallopeptidase [bacterium]
MKYFFSVFILFFYLISFAGEGEDFVDIGDFIKESHVNMIYSTSDNFTGRDMYGSFDRCFLRKEVASMLKKAHNVLKKNNPELTFLIYDCLRPRSVQWSMWKVVKKTPQQKYVAYPGRGSVHNYGAAVDLTLAAKDGTPVDMGTPVDYFGKKAQPRYESLMIKKGELSKSQLKNRRLLRSVMREAGFRAIASEWWHFNAFSVKEVRKRYKIIENISDIQKKEKAEAPSSKKESESSSDH